jgi:hypothetical protein
VTLSVDVLTPSWFPRAPGFPAALDVENAVAVFDDSFRVNLSEPVGGETWSGIRRHYLIYPQLAGTYTVPPVDVDVVYALPDAKPSDPVKLTTPGLRFRARVPPEAADLGYFIAGRGFHLDQKVEPASEGLKVGDAVTRTITMSATDASSMMLPITRFPPFDGLAVYPDPTRASDTGGERGSAREATRVDSATYVLETEGSFTLPEIRLSWWDVEAGRLREASVPSVSFDVVPNPDLTSEIALPDETADAEAVPAEPEGPSWWRRARLVLGAGVALLLLGGLARRYGPRLRARVEEAQRARRESEAAHFDRVLGACRRNDASGTMRALLAWVDRITPPGRVPTVQRLVDHARDAGLAVTVRELETALYGSGEAAAWRGRPLAGALEAARRSGKAEDTAHAPALLSPLNPPG